MHLLGIRFMKMMTFNADTRRLQRIYADFICENLRWICENLRSECLLLNN